MTPINLALCRIYLDNAAHRGNCPLCWQNEIPGKACTCGLDDLRSLVSGMQAGTAQSISVEGTLTCGVPNCGLKDVPHRHVKVDK